VLFEQTGHDNAQLSASAHEFQDRSEMEARMPDSSFIRSVSDSERQSTGGPAVALRKSRCGSQAESERSHVEKSAREERRRLSYSWFRVLENERFCHDQEPA
jgi:hypothetical protein